MMSKFVAELCFRSNKFMIILIAALKEAFNLTVIGRRQKQPPEVYYRNKCS